MAQRLKSAMLDGRAAAERLLLKERHGGRCAQRLCFMHDEIIRLLYEFARRHLYPSDVIVLCQFNDGMVTRQCLDLFGVERLIQP